MMQPLEQPQSQSSDDENISPVQCLARWIVQQKDQQHQTLVNFSQLHSEFDPSQESYNFANLMERIKEELRDSSSAIISTEIHQYNFKSSKQSGKFINCPISECFSSISSKILSNYINSLKFIMLIQNQNKQQETEKDLTLYLAKLQNFMKKYLEYMELKYTNYCGQDDNGMMVVPFSQVERLLESIQDAVINSQEKRKLNNKKNSSHFTSNNSMTIQKVKIALSNELNKFSIQGKTSFTRYEKLFKKINPKIKFRCREELNQLVGQKKTTMDSFKKQTKLNYVIRMMLEMIDVLKQRNGNSKISSITVEQKQDKFMNAFKQKNFNFQNQQQSSQKSMKKQNKDMKTKLRGQNYMNSSVKQKNKQSQKCSKTTINFSQFFQKTYFGQYKTKNLSKNQQAQNEMKQEQILSIAQEYSQLMYQKAFQRLSNQLYLYLSKGNAQFDQFSNNVESELSIGSIIVGLVSQNMTLLQKNPLINAYIQCNNQTLTKILKQINQMALNKEIQVMEVKNNMQKNYDHSLIINFRLTNQSKLPCQLKIRLDQRLSASSVLRQNYQMLENFIRRLGLSPFGVIGQMALYYLSTNQSKV